MKLQSSLNSISYASYNQYALTDTLQWFQRPAPQTNNTKHVKTTNKPPTAAHHP